MRGLMTTMILIYMLIRIVIESYNGRWRHLTIFCFKSHFPLLGPKQVDRTILQPLNWWRFIINSSSSSEDFKNCNHNDNHHIVIILKPISSLSTSSPALFHSLESAFDLLKVLTKLRRLFLANRIAATHRGEAARLHLLPGHLGIMSASVSAGESMLFNW